MAETDIAMPESTAVDSRPAFAIIEELKTKFGENFYVQTTREDFPTVWVERARVQEVLMFLRTVSRPYVMLFDLSVVASSIICSTSSCVYIFIIVPLSGSFY